MTFQWTSPEFFFSFQIFWHKVLKLTKTSEKAHLFHNIVLLKKPHSFYQSQFTRHCRKYAPATPPKTFLILQIFQQMFDIVRKNIFTATFPDAQELHSGSNLKASRQF